ncbi:MAG: hypothetical protein KME30_17770 [Iphinoe sp. HA4291-MV1]|jgi:hypothetical protein|nr:hypothetical protein [Iphinoe sp. HA4291-MV1]
MKYGFQAFKRDLSMIFERLRSAHSPLGNRYLSELHPQKLETAQFRLDT